MYYFNTIYVAFTFVTFCASSISHLLEIFAFFSYRLGSIAGERSWPGPSTPNSSPQIMTPSKKAGHACSECELSWDNLNHVYI